jgi:hypothetical protein
MSLSVDQGSTAIPHDRMIGPGAVWVCGHVRDMSQAGHRELDVEHDVNSDGIEYRVGSTPYAQACPISITI